MPPVAKNFESILQFLSDFKNILDNSVQQKEMVEVIEVLSNEIKKTEKKVSEVASGNHETLKKDVNELYRQVESIGESILASAKVKEKNDATLKKMESTLVSLRGEINAVRLEIPELPEIKDYTPEIEKLRSEIPAIPEAFDATEIIEDIEKLEKKVEELVKRPTGKGGGMTDRAIQYAAMRIIQAVTPAGTIDGINTDFELPSTIHAVLSFELNSRVVALGEYSIIGGARKMIRFDTAPSASYSGKSFVITYL
jgi:mRNA-degrading endonuclease YafQ of YafQ-DinJ toxin-antitoxin module